jgi:KDO2-lipid IV(A) lauroyltransferase
MTATTRLATPRPSLRGSLALGGAALAARLPEGPLVAAAESAGEIWYRLAPARRAQARANLARVCEGLAASGRGSRMARQAATDPEALERLVRACFRHTARYYLEVARAGAYDVDTAIARVHLDTPDEVREATSGGVPVLVIGLHFGAIELPVVLLSHLVGRRVTAPMEDVADPALQRWFVSSRSRVGVDIVPLANSRRVLVAALRRGESVGLVADRDLSGSGIEVPLFGHLAPIPAGPALLSLETGAPIYVSAARRTGDGTYRVRMIPVTSPEAGTRRERLVALTAAMTLAFESIIADAPEQWWGAFHPIWPDLAVPHADDPGDVP